MSARGGGRRRRGGHAEHENEERWLLTYADMITLLMALFMVLFSISSVNISKYKSLTQSLKDAFSGHVLPGGKAIMKSGADNAKVPASASLISPVKPAPGSDKAQEQKTEEEFQKIKKQIDAYARSHGFTSQVQTTVSRRGLVVRLLTDEVLFDTGPAALKPGAMGLLSGVGHAINLDRTHPIMVEGHTDNVPIAGSQFPTSWELSTARASAVVRFLIRVGIDRFRLGAAGYANLYPVASNSTESGRSKNRRVEIVLLRQNQSITLDIPGNG